MQKINFQNLPSTTTPINATNLNAIQTNAETAINNVASDIPTKVSDITNDLGFISKVDYAAFISKNATITIEMTAWTPHQIPFGSNAGFSRNGTDFEANGNFIRCKFNGSVLIIREYSDSYSGSHNIITNEGGWINGTQAITTRNVVNYENINFEISGSQQGQISLYDYRLIVIRLS